MRLRWIGYKFEIKKFEYKYLRELKLETKLLFYFVRNIKNHETVSNKNNLSNIGQHQ